MRSFGKMPAWGLRGWEGEGDLPPPPGVRLPGGHWQLPAAWTPSLQSEGENKDHSSSPPLSPREVPVGGLYGGHAALLPSPTPQPLSLSRLSTPTRAPTGVLSFPPGDGLINIMHLSNSSERSSLSSPSGAFPAWNISRGGISPRFPLRSPCRARPAGPARGERRGVTSWVDPRVAPVTWRDARVGDGCARPSHARSVSKGPWE